MTDTLNQIGAMSDEDFLDQDFYAEPETVDTEESESEEEVLESEENEEESDITESETEDVDLENESELDDTEEEGLSEEEDSSESLDEENSDDEEESDEEENEEKEEDSQSDFEKQILAPFKANGKMAQVHSADEAIRLMQMGANYNKKMSSLKPQLKIIKMLENNKLLDEGKLNYLIDLSHKDKGAISKLLKEAEIDPLDLDEDGTEYAPKSYTVSDKEYNLDEVLASIEDTDTYKDTMEVISTKWDDSSRQALVSDPKKIAVINTMMGSGAYKHITDTIEQRDMLGQLPTGLSDIELFELVGEQLYPLPQANQPESKGKIPYTPKKQNKQSPKLNKSKKVLSRTKSAKPKVNTVVDDSNLSDEDFLRQFNS